MTSAFLSALALAFSLAPQQSGVDLSARLHGIVRAAVADAELPGAAVRVSTQHGVLFERGLGYQDGARHIVEHADHVRSVEPLLEPLLCAALLSQVGQGRLRLDQPLVEHFPKLGFEGRKIQVGQLLDHTSGIPSYVDWLALRGVPTTAADVLAWLETRGVDSEPGSCRSCSESNTLLIGLLVAKLADEPLDTCLRNAVIDPLGLGETALRDVAAPRPASYALSERLPTVRELLGLPALRSTLADMDAFLRAIGEGRVVGPDGQRHLLEPLRDGGEEGARAAGLALARLGRNGALAFGGAGPAGSLHVAWYPDLGLVISVASAAETTVLPALERRLARAVLDLPEPGIVDVPLSKAQREPYLGGYYIGCTRVTIEERGEQLEFVSPYGERHVLRYQGHERFVSRSDPDTTLEFSVQHGRAESFVLTQRGLQTTARRLD